MAKIVTLMLNASVDVMLEFDEFIKTKTNRVKNHIEHMGGKGLNVSKVAKSFGLEVCATGFIGKDKKEELARILNDAGIEDVFVEIDGKTRTNYKLLDRKDASVTEVNSEGFSVSKEKLTELLDVLKIAIKEAEILVLTGSLPEGVDSGFYAECIKIANEKGIKTVLDASGEALEKALKEKPYAIKPNIDELSQLAGKNLTDEEDVIDQIAKLSDLGISFVTVSMGAEGAIFASRGKYIVARTFDIEFKSAVGAGDSMVGAICYCIANNIEIETAARLAVGAGCITTSKIGTNLCSAEEVLESQNKVAIMEVER